jgi:hypothetical protein
VTPLEKAAIDAARAMVKEVKEDNSTNELFTRFLGYRDLRAALATLDAAPTQRRGAGCPVCLDTGYFTTNPEEPNPECSSCDYWERKYAARRDEADAAMRAKVAEARVEVLRTALGEAVGIAEEPDGVPLQVRETRIVKWLFAARAALGAERGTDHE